MEIIGLQISALSLVAALVLMVRRGRAAARHKRDTLSSRVAQAVQVSELAQQAYVVSLDHLYKNVESLGSRIAAAERQLDRLIESRSGTRAGERHSAPRLLEYGGPADESAAQIDLPLGAPDLAQVAQEAMQLADKISAARAGVNMEKTGAPGKNPEPRQPLARPQPILLTEVVSAGKPVTGAEPAAAPRCNDAAA